MNCKNCGYGLKQRCGDFEKIICTYEEGECVKITELEAQIKKMKRCAICKSSTIIDLGYCEIRCSGNCNNYDKWELAD